MVIRLASSRFSFKTTTVGLRPRLDAVRAFTDVLFQNHYGWIETLADTRSALPRDSFQNHYGWIETSE